MDLNAIFQTGFMEIHMQTTKAIVNMADEDSESSVNLKTKLVQLGTATDKTATVLSTGKESSIKRHVEALREILNDVSKLVRTVEAEKITVKQNIDEIKTWVDGMETKINDGDEKIKLLEEWLSEAQEKREIDDHKKRMNFEFRNGTLRSHNETTS